MEIQDVLKIELTYQGQKVTIREFFKLLLVDLFQRGRGYNEDIEDYLWRPLVRSGAVKGVIDGNGNLQEIDKIRADKLIQDCIGAL